MAKKMIIKGVGTFMAKRPKEDGGVEVITLGTLQNLRIDMNVEIEDIFGGDGLFAIDTLVRSKSIEISATDAKFDLNALSLMMGSTLRESQTESIWVLAETAEIAPDGTVTPKYPVVVNEDVSVRLQDSNKLLTRISGEEPAEGEFAVAADGKSLIFPAELAGASVVFNYKRSVENVDIVDILGNEVPFPVHVVHNGSFLQKDGSYQGVETELYSCIANGTFTIDAQRATASSSTVTLRVIDPERADGKLGTVKRYKL